MFKVLVAFSLSSGSYEGGRATALEVVEFDTQAAANAAVDRINRSMINGLKAIALY